MEISLLTYLWAIPLIVVVGCFLGALVLQAACALCNVELGFGKAIGLNLLRSVINVPIVAGFGYLAALLGSDLGMSKELLTGGIGLVNLLLVWAISAFILSLLLPLSFFKGMLAATLDGIIWLVLTGIVGGLILVLLAGLQLAA